MITFWCTSCCRHINPSSIWDEILWCAGNPLGCSCLRLLMSPYYHLQWSEGILLTLSLNTAFSSQVFSSKWEETGGRRSFWHRLPWDAWGHFCSLAPCPMQKAFLTHDCHLYCIFLQGLHLSCHHQAPIRSSTQVFNSRCLYLCQTWAVKQRRCGSGLAIW